MQLPLSIVIQSGGESRRMGQDKGLVSFLGQPLVQRAVERLRSLTQEILVTTNHPEAYAFLDVPLFPDLIPGRGALGGLYTALSVASQPLVAVVACDMPLINSRLLEAQYEKLIAAQADIVIPHTGEGLEPFHAIYRSEACLPPIRQAIDEGKWRVDAWFNCVRLELFRQEEITQYDPQMLSFRNVNTPEELQAVQELAGRLSA